MIVSTCIRPPPRRPLSPPQARCLRTASARCVRSAAQRLGCSAGSGESDALAKSELFVGRVGRLLEAVGQIPIHQHSIDTRALRRAVTVLEEGHLLGIFPEGGRDTGDMARIRGGAIYLAMVTGAPIVPVALIGTREPGQTISDVPRRGAAVHIVYGEPIAIDRTPWPRRQQVVAAHTEEVRRRLAAHVARAEVLTGMALPGAPAPKVPAAA